MCDRGSIHNLNMGGLFHEDPIERSIIMGKITKKEIKKLLKAARKKEFRKCIEDQIIKEANKKTGSADPIVIDACIEIGVEKTEGVVSSGKIQSSALRRCTYICYVIGGTRICRRICY